ncbi:mechanosensitive ion channel family protein [Sphingomonas aquatilis]|uniref:mechanosensitive ion channel family protein n=1 Tax=Sphingomonas aquatilis TaxID=93063 RepID=UPI0023F758EB|nr:mechanosensitive ion channel family protein [Sphingomonas aquatilis]MCI4653648.1 mechanosensitive ion channel family protein [Sphingomonas aquatilis]
MQSVTPPPAKNPLDLITAKLHVASNDFFLQLPNIIGGIVFVIVAWFAGKLIANGVRRAFHQKGLIDLGGVLASLTFGLVVAAAVLIACVIVFPSVKPATIISSLGVGSVAIGFAFKDILQNLLAGILLLINRPYRRGDQIVVKDFEGTVEHIQSRATLIKTYDGRRVIIPNSDVYTSPVMVNTAFPVRRDQFDIGIGYGDKPDRAMTVFAEAIANVEGVEADPAPEVLPWGLDASSVTLRARWWSESKRTNIVHLRARVILAIWQAAADNGIDLPFPTQQILFHDQTEETDGDRTRQREGWPAGANPPRPRRSERQHDDDRTADQA